MTLLALENGAGTGRILLGPITVTAGGNGTGQNGDVVMIGSATSGNSVSIAAVNNIESSKAPKNGIQGTLSATNNGLVVVTNTLGGLYVNSSNSLQAQDISLTAGGKGSISSAGTITASGTLSLTANTGTIGKGGLTISTPNVGVNSNGSVSLTSTLNGALSIVDGSTSSDFELNALSQVTVQNLTALDGSISVNSGAGTLTVTTGAQVQATNGGIILTNSDIANGDILIGDNSTIATGGKGDIVVIAIGPAPKKVTNTTAPVGVTVQTQGKGLAFFGPDPGVVATTTANVNAINKNVIFNNLSNNIATKKITLGSASTVTADPPSRSVSNMVLTTGTPGDIASLDNTVMMSEFDRIPTINDNASARALYNTTSASGFDNILNSFSNFANLISLNNAVPNTESLSEPMPYAEASACTTDLIVDADFVIEQESPLHEFATNNGAGVVTLMKAASGNRSTRHNLANGNGIFAPRFDTTIKTSMGSIELKAGAIALIMQSNEGLAVYDLHDECKNSIVINTGNKMFSLSPGRHLLISQHQNAAFESVNPLELVHYRKLNQLQLGNGYKAFTAEFAIPSACYAVKSLQQLMSSKHNEALGLARRIHKTTAIMMTIAPDCGDYVQYFNPRATAMVR